MSVTSADCATFGCALCGRTLADYTTLIEHEAGCSEARFAARSRGLGIPSVVASIFSEQKAAAAAAAAELNRWPPVLASEDSRLPYADVDADLIMPGLWLGSASAARNEAFLHAAHVRAIINCAAEARSLPAARRAALGISHYHQAAIDDTDEVDFAEEIAGAVAQMSAAMQRFAGVATATIACAAASAGFSTAVAAAHSPETSQAAEGSVLVHCAAGVSRSAAVVMGFLLSHAGLPLTHAALLVRLRRPSAYPNAGFWRTLMRFELTLHARKALRCCGTPALMLFGSASSAAKCALDGGHGAAVAAAASSAPASNESGTVGGAGSCAMGSSVACAAAFPAAALWLHRALLAVPLPPEVGISDAECHAQAAAAAAASASAAEL